MEGYKIISVESRKGGVGKTTVARLLADIVTASYRDSRNGNVRAVVIDLDILGTDSVDFVKTIPGEYIQTAGSCLLECFNGKTFSNKIKLEKWKIDEKRIFYIPSLLSSYSKKEHRIKYNPQLLFDELHSKWFMDFLKELFQQFVSNYNEDYELVFILDNPPGYSEFVPVLEDYLVEIGPEIGKTIFVCSLDKQDLQACAAGMRLLYKKYRKALLAAQYYHSITWRDDKAVKKVDEESNKSAAGGANSKEKESQYFNKGLFDALLNKELAKDNFYNSSKTILKYRDYYTDPKWCIGLLVNKVPPNLDEEYLKSNFNVKMILRDMEELGKYSKFEKYFRERLFEDYVSFSPGLAYQFIIGNFVTGQVKIHTVDDKDLRTEIEKSLTDFKREVAQKPRSPKQEVIQGITRQFYSFFLIDNLEKTLKKSGAGNSYILFDPRFKFSVAGLKLFNQPMGLVPESLRMKKRKVDDSILSDKRLREAAERKSLSLGKVEDKSLVKTLAEKIYKQCIEPIEGAYESGSNVMASVVLALPLEILKDTLSENSAGSKSGSEFAASPYNSIQAWWHEFTSEFIRMQSEGITDGDESALRHSFRKTFFNPDLLPDDYCEALDKILDRNEIKMKRKTCVQALSYLILRYLDLESDLEFFMNCCYNLKNPEIEKNHVYLISKAIDHVVVEKTHEVEGGKEFLKSTIGLAYMSDIDSEEDTAVGETIDFSFIDSETAKLKTALARIWDDWCHVD